MEKEFQGTVKYMYHLHEAYDPTDKMRLAIYIYWMSPIQIPTRLDPAWPPRPDKTHQVQYGMADIGYLRYILRGNCRIIVVLRYVIKAEGSEKLSLH